MAQPNLPAWLAYVRRAPHAWLAQATTGAFAAGRAVLHTAYLPGQMRHYVAARQARFQLDALATEWGRRGETALSLQLYRMADNLIRIVRHHELELSIRALGGGAAVLGADVELVGPSIAGPPELD